MKRTITTLSVAAALILSGCGQTDTTTDATDTNDETVTQTQGTPTDEAPTGEAPTEQATTGLTTFDEYGQGFLTSDDDGFDFYGITVKLAKAERMPVDEVEVISDDEDRAEWEDATPVRLHFTFENTGDDAFPLDEVDSTEYVGENFAPADSPAGIMDGEPVNDLDATQIAPGSTVDYYTTVTLPDEFADDPILVEMTLSGEAMTDDGTPQFIEYTINPDVITDWQK